MLILIDLHESVVELSIANSNRLFKTFIHWGKIEGKMATFVVFTLFSLTKDSLMNEGWGF